LADGSRIPAGKALQQPDVTLRGLADSGRLALEIAPTTSHVDVASVETEFKYEGYLRRELESIARRERHETRGIPADFVFEGIPGLSREMVQRLTEARPGTLGQASRIPGITPAAVAVVDAHLNRGLPTAAG